MKGIKVPGGEGNGISTGTLWLLIADVEIGGNEMVSPVMPTARRTTTFWIDRGFWAQMFNIERPLEEDKGAYFDSHPTGRGCVCNKVQDQVTYVLSSG